MTEAKIYVGLNDATTKLQKYNTEKYIKVMKYVCRSYHVPFSFAILEGGYFHENGDYSQEHTLVLTLIDGEKNVVEAIATDLCAFFNQESVLITESMISKFLFNFAHRRI